MCFAPFTAYGITTWRRLVFDVGWLLGIRCLDQRRRRVHPP
jgi:hypothetical protein